MTLKAFFKRFLLSGGAISLDGGAWTAEPLIRDLAIALRATDILTLRQHMNGFPSYQFLSSTLEAHPIGVPFDLERFKRAARTYGTLAEVTRLGCPIAGEGFYSTPFRPDAEAFAPIAFTRFQELAQGERLVATGAWLEFIVRNHGIHPELSKPLLNEASGLGLLLRSTEGSTTELRFNGHVIQVLRISEGRPTVLTVHLYRGDYLIPGTSSSSLRIEER